MFKTWWLMGAAVLGASLLGSWAGSGEARAAGDPTLVGAGDIASCASPSDEAAARLLDNMRGTVFAVGDTAYPDGTAAQFADCYGPSWGRHKDRTRPAVGNHEYYTPGAAGYFGYFGDAAGDPAEGYYSCDRGAWHIVVLNSNCSEVPCAEGSAQERWLEADLAANPTRCTLAYFHHPRFSSAGNNFDVTPFWQDLYAAGAEVVLSGHTHNYERFAPPEARRHPGREAGHQGFRGGHRRGKP